MSKLATLCMIAAVALSPVGASAQQSDDFNSANAPTLGAGWTQQSGSSSIVDNRATGSTLSLATFNGATGNVISFDLFRTGTGLQYAAAVFGYGEGANIFVKVQNNGGSAFNAFGFYTGNNNGGGPFGFFTEGFDSGRVTVSLAGSVATLLIEPTAGLAQTYTHDYGFAPEGSSVGLGFYGSAQVDNFSTNASVTAPATVPEPASASLLLLAIAGLGAAARRRHVRSA